MSPLHKSFHHNNNSNLVDADDDGRHYGYPSEKQQREAVAPLSTNLLVNNYSRSPPSRPLNARSSPPRKPRSSVFSVLIPRAWSNPAPPPASPPHPFISLTAPPKLPPVHRHSFLDPATFDREEYWLDSDSDSEIEQPIAATGLDQGRNRLQPGRHHHAPSHKWTPTVDHISPASPAQTVSPSTTAAYLFCVPSPAIGAFATPAALRSKKSTERVGKTRGKPLNASYKPPLSAGGHKRRRFVHHARSPTATFPQIPSFANSRSPTYPPRIHYNPNLSLAQAAKKPTAAHRSPRTPPRRRYRRARGPTSSPTKAIAASRSRTSLRHPSRSRLHRPSVDRLLKPSRSLFRRRAARILHDHRPAPKPPINPTVLAAMQAIVDQTAFPVKRSGVDGIALPNGSPPPRVVVNEEDARIAWSMQFWVTIADPVVSFQPGEREIGSEFACRKLTLAQTQHVFFACPATGE